MFDVDKALAGEPVRLRNGEKAYIKTRSLPNSFHPETYYIGSYTDINDIEHTIIWNIEGKFSIDEHKLDIVGMYSDVPKQEEPLEPELYPYNLTKEEISFLNNTNYSSKVVTSSGLFERDTISKGGVVVKTSNNNHIIFYLTKDGSLVHELTNYYKISIIKPIL